MPDNQSFTQTVTEEVPVRAQKRVAAPILVVSAVLLLQIALFYSLSTKEYIPYPPPLKIFQSSVGPWNMIAETELQTDVQELLRADDTLNRQYQGNGSELNLFVAFFKSQRAGVTPHSPKVCLPGNGWIPEDAKILSVP